MSELINQTPLSSLSKAAANVHVDAFEDGDDALQILSQWCVVARVARSCPELRLLIEAKSDNIFAEEGESGLREILEETRILLEKDRDLSPLQKTYSLIDENAPYWNGRSEEHYWRPHVLNMIAEEDPEDSDEYDVPMQWAEWLTTTLIAKTTMGLGIPLDVYKVMSNALSRRGMVGLVGDCSAIGLITIHDENIPLDMHVYSQSSFQLTGRLLFLSGRKGDVSLISPNGIGTESSESCRSYLSVPPWNVRTFLGDIELPRSVGKISQLRSESLEIARLINEKKPATVLVPAGFLHQSSTKGMRRWLVDEGAVTTVVEFPGRLLTGTSVPFAILVLYGPRHVSSKVRMIDAMPYLAEQRQGRYTLRRWTELSVAISSEPNGKPLPRNECLVDEETLAANDYQLNPKRYLGYEQEALDELIGDTPQARLDELAVIIRPTPITLNKAKDQKSDTDMDMVEVLISDIDDDGVVRSGSKKRTIPKALANRIEKFRLKPNDILIGTKGSVGKAGIADSSIDDNLICGQTMVIIRLALGNSVELPEYLYRYLVTPQVSAFLKARAGGSAIQFIKAEDLGALPVPIYTLEKQQEIATVHQDILDKKQQAKALNAEADWMSERAFEELSEQQHAQDTSWYE